MTGATGRSTRKGVKYEGTHPRFISQALFDMVQEVLASQKMAGDRTRKKHGHYLVGSIYCRQWGRRLMFTKCTGRAGRKFDYLVLPRAAQEGQIL